MNIPGFPLFMGNDSKGDMHFSTAIWRAGNAHSFAYYIVNENIFSNSP